MTLFIIIVYDKYVCVVGEMLMLRSEDNFMKSILSFHLNMAFKDQAQVCVARALTGLVISPPPPCWHTPEVSVFCPVRWEQRY